jgi:hypothetical protein
LKLMSDDELPDLPDDDEDEEDSNEEDLPDIPALRSALDAFSRSQRLLASLDLSVFAAAQRTIDDSGILDAVADIQRSVNFSALQDVAKSIQLASSIAVPVIDPKWIEQLTKSIDVSAIARANELILANSAVVAASQQQADALAAIAGLSRVGCHPISDRLTTWIPWRGSHLTRACLSHGFHELRSSKN